MFDTEAMTALAPDLTAALATLRSRWGAAAPSTPAGFGQPDEVVGDVVGALATVPLPGEPSPFGIPGRVPDRQPSPAPERDSSRIFSTGFAALDAILGPGGLPRGMGVSLRGDLSSGRTTLALRLAAEAQAAGSIVAWLDLAAALDPVEAIARGVRPEWLVVLTPADAEEGLAIAGSLLSGRAVDLLVIDLPARLPAAARVADRLGRLAAMARRSGITLVVLEPPALAASLVTAVGEATGVRLELARRSWIRLGRDVVGQRTEVLVARNRAGPPGRRATLRILYADGGERDACLRRDGLLVEPEPRARPESSAEPTSLAPVIPVPGNRNDATPPSLSTAPPPRSREAAPALRLVAGGAAGPRWQAVVSRERHGRGPRGPLARRPARDGAGVGTPAGAGGDLPRRRSGG
jgi:RecA/RadA recombinase